MSIINQQLRSVFSHPFIFSLAALDKAISLSVDGSQISAICGEVDSFIEAEL